MKKLMAFLLSCTIIAGVLAQSALAAPPDFLSANTEITQTDETDSDTQTDQTASEENEQTAAGNKAEITQPAPKSWISLRERFPSSMRAIL